MAGKAMIPAHVIAARGRKITLIDGSTPTLVFGFSSIMRLEEDFGSLGDAMGSLQDNPKIGTIATIMCAGLEHESIVVTEDVDGQTKTVRSGLLSELDILRHMLDSTLISDYTTAIVEAFELSFPNVGGDDDAEADPTEGESSPGPTGTTPQPSSSDEQIESSGA